MNNETVCAVVVTYNRLDLLKENISSLKEQTKYIDKIIIVNNASSDDTKKYLDSFIDDSQMAILNLKKNIGGSGGFSEGIKAAGSFTPKWVWLMDDDTIPRKDALQKLLEKSNIVDKTGFLCSRVLFTDNKPHLMNNHLPTNNELLNIQWNAFFNEKVLSLSTCSFVSCLISFEAIKIVGLPYKEFFIWCDDSEYTKRITNASYFGGLVTDSIVIHKTKENYNANLITADDSISWKFYYGARNSVFCAKKSKTHLKFIIWYIYNYWRNMKYLKMNKNKKSLLKKSVKKGLVAGLFFNPKIEPLL